MICCTSRMTSTASRVLVCTPSILRAMSSAAWALWLASSLISWATTAKPLPASPAEVASIVAFSASRLVCRAIILIVSVTLPMSAAERSNSFMVVLAPSAMLMARLAICEPFPGIVRDRLEGPRRFLDGPGHGRHVAGRGLGGRRNRAHVDADLLAGRRDRGHIHAHLLGGRGHGGDVGASSARCCRRRARPGSSFPRSAPAPGATPTKARSRPRRCSGRPPRISPTILPNDCGDVVHRPGQHAHLVALREVQALGQIALGDRFGEARPLARWARSRTASSSTASTRLMAMPTSGTPDHQPLGIPRRIAECWSCRHADRC